MSARNSAERPIIALDSETTGRDFFHGARPFFVTICDGGLPLYWQWDVDPLTRNVLVPRGDLIEIEDAVSGASRIVMQNGKFDVRALWFAGIDGAWPWEKTDELLLMAHLLGSNQPKDLTSLASVWLGKDIGPWEDRLREACVAGRRLVQQARLRVKRGKASAADERLAAWRIAEYGLPEMPSVKKGSGKEDRAWKNDSWLPRALRRAGHGPPEWDAVLADYANVDSETTWHLRGAMLAEINRRGLRCFYEERVKLPPVIWHMEQRGITLDRAEMIRLRDQFRAESERQVAVMMRIADRRGAELTLPKGGRNDSLESFVFDVLKLPPVHNPKSKTGNPSIDSKFAIPFWLDTLPAGSDGLAFVEALESKRTHDTAVSYLDGYERYAISFEREWCVLHPSINITGTDTMRRSHNNPNSANVGKGKAVNLRRCFGPAPGREWWTFDAQNIELRIPAYESGERELIDLFERSNEPPYYGSEHLLNFSTVYLDIWEGELGTVCDDPNCCNGKTVDISRIGPHVKVKFKDTWYQWCKNGDFAVGYGAIDRDDGQGTADRTFRRPGSQARLKARFAKKEAHNQRCIQFANKHGWIETVPSKTCDPSRGYPLLCSRSKWGDVKPTVPLNYRTQGTAGEWMQRAMIRVHALTTAWQREGFDAFISIEVHDELVLDFPRGARGWRSNWQRALEVKRLMEMGGDDIGIPTPVSVEWHPKNWAEGEVIKAPAKTEEGDAGANVKEKVAGADPSRIVGRQARDGRVHGLAVGTGKKGRDDLLFVAFQDGEPDRRGIAR